MILQNDLANYSFLTLLASMIFYWVETALTGIRSPEKSLTTPLLSVPQNGEVVSDSSLNNSTSLMGKSNQSLAKYGVILSNILLGLLLGLRWIESGHFPLSNLYESLMFLSWCFTLLHLYIDYYTPLLDDSIVKLSNSNGMSQQKQQSEAFPELARKLFGAITTPSALLTNAFATFTLPKEMQEASPLVPALQSNWLMMHVTVMVLSYAALILGSLLSIAFLIVTMGSNSKVQVNTKVESLASTLDNLSYRILGIAFPLLTIGILSGAVWANEAWGSYWSWDPKETWALLTWLIFAIYLHTRISKGWTGKKPAIIASLGFVVVWICYLGVNLIGAGLHSYGWLVQS